MPHKERDNNKEKIVRRNVIYKDKKSISEQQDNNLAVDGRSIILKMRVMEE